MTRFATGLTAVATVLTLAACGSSSSNGTGSGPTGAPAKPIAHACSIVSQAEAQAAFGGPLSSPKEDTQPVPSCYFYSTDLSNVADGLDVQIQDLTVFNGAKAGSAQGGMQVTPLSGVGDDAYYQVPKDGGAQSTILLAVRRGNNVVFIAMSKAGSSPEQIEAMEKTLALSIVGKL